MYLRYCAVLFYSFALFPCAQYLIITRTDCNVYFAVYGYVITGNRSVRTAFVLYQLCTGYKLFAKTDCVCAFLQR